MKKIKLTNVLFIIYMLAMLASLVMFPLSSAIDGTKADRDFESFDDCWYLNSSLTTKVDISEPSELRGYGEGKNIRFYARLPETLEKGTSLNFRMKNSFTEIYILDEYGNRTLVRGKDELNESLFGKSVGTLWIDIPLDSTDAGRIIEIVFTPCYDDSSSHIDTFMLGRTADIVSFSITERVISAATCILMLFVGVALLIVHIIMKRIVKDMSSEMFFLGLFSAVTALWALIETKFLNFLNLNTGALHNFSCMMLTLIILPLFMFYQRDIGKKNSFVVPLVSIVSILDFTLCTVLHFTGVLDYHESLTITHISIGIGCVCLVYTTIVRLFKDKVKYSSDVVSAIGMLVIAIFAFIDIIRYRTGAVTDSALFTRIGLLIYIISLGICSLSYTAQMVKKGTKSEIVARLAYEDVLTGMGNRTAYKERVADLESTAEECTVFVFDINNLKYVNDNMGHQIGDKMIAAAAEVMSKVFEDSGKCYRIGGDEFVVIAEGILDTQMYSNIFYQEIDCYIEKNEPDFPLAVALGAGVCGRNDKIREVIDIADQAMYECKAEMKKASGISNGR